MILSGPYSSPILFRKDAYKSRDGPVAWEKRAAMSARGRHRRDVRWSAGCRRGGGHNTKVGRVHTIARWKSGFPFAVVAKSVNCETQRTSPSMSLTFFFHIAPDPSSEKTLSDRLRVRGRGRERGSQPVALNIVSIASQPRTRRDGQTARQIRCRQRCCARCFEEENAHLFCQTLEVGHGVVCSARGRAIQPTRFPLNGQE